MIVQNGKVRQELAKPAQRRPPPVGSGELTAREAEALGLLAKGFQVVPGSFWERVGECDSETHGRDTVHVIDSNLLEGVHVNQYLLDEENFFAAAWLNGFPCGVR